MKRIVIILGVIAACTAQSAPVSIGYVDWTNQDLKDSLKEFTELYKKRPIKDNQGGMLAPQMFFTWFIVKRLQPKFIIESGVWKGQSTWLFEQAAPRARIISLDPKLEYRVYISPRVDYRRADFANIDWSFLDPKETVCFFDDHYGLDRIKECLKRGFKHILYEDNYPIPGGNQFHPSGNALSPKAAFKACNADADFLYDVIKTYYEFPPIIPSRKDNYRFFYEYSPIALTKKNFSWNIYKEETPEPLYDDVIESYLQIFHDQAYNYNWYAYIELE